MKLRLIAGIHRRIPKTTFSALHGIDSSLKPGDDRAMTRGRNPG